VAADYERNWLGRLRGRVYQQFKDKPNLDAVVRAIAKQAQDLEDSAQLLLLLASIDDQEGEQLRTIGRIVGQLWSGQADALYRLYLRARIKARRSSGTPSNLYAVFFAMFGGAANVTMSVDNPDTATVLVHIDTPMDAAAALVATGFLGEAKVGGVRAILEWQPAADADTFCFDGGPGLGFGSETDTTLGGAFAGASQPA
jgi:hypothetical protein